MRVAFLSHTAAGGVFRVGSHHLSRELARGGHEVAHVSTPLSPVHVLRTGRNIETRNRLGQARHPGKEYEGVSHFVPWSLLPITRVPAPLREALAKIEVSRWQRCMPVLRSLDMVFLDQPFLIDHAIALSAKRLIYRPTDAHFETHARSAELRALMNADGVAATSARTLQSVTSDPKWNGPACVIENGVEFDRFAITGPSSRTGVIYLGSLDRRFDWGALSAMAAGHPSIPFTIAGPIVGTPPSPLPENVSLVGPVKYEEAPNLLARHQVGILPLSDDPGNASRSPMKYYEYLANGLSVVATRAPSLDSRRAPNVWLYRSIAEAASVLGAALNSDSELREAGVEYASRHSWRACACELEQFALEILDRRPQ